MKITIEYVNNKYSLEIEEDLDIYDMAEVLKKMLFLIGFHYDNIKELFLED